jgi:hypothetical protein
VSLGNVNLLLYKERGEEFLLKAKSEEELGREGEEEA